MNAFRFYLYIFFLPSSPLLVLPSLPSLRFPSEERRNVFRGGGANALWTGLVQSSLAQTPKPPSLIHRLLKTEEKHGKAKQSKDRQTDRQTDRGEALRACSSRCSTHNGWLSRRDKGAAPFLSLFNNLLLLFLMRLLL